MDDTRRFLLLLPLVLLLAACSNSAPEPVAQDPLLEPFKNQVEAPQSYKVRLETTKGEILLLVNRPWAPYGADRFYNLVKLGYFTDVAFYRVTGQFAQFGFHGASAVNVVWANAFLPVDPPRQSNRRGFLSFAQAGSPERRSTQLFINLKDNTYLDRAFAPIGRVVAGMEVLDRLYNGYSESVVQGRLLYEGNAYLKKSFPRLDYIKRATMVE